MIMGILTVPPFSSSMMQKAAHPARLFLKKPHVAERMSLVDAHIPGISGKSSSCPVGRSIGQLPSRKPHAVCGCFDSRAYV